MTMAPFQYPPSYPQQAPELQAILATITDLQAKTNAQIFKDKDEAGNEKVSWKKRFPMQKQSFVLFASTSADKVVPESPTEEYLSLLETKKEHSLSMVEHGIVSQRGGSQVVDHALASSLYTGTFCNSEGNGPPKGISIFFAVPAPSVYGSAAMGEEELALRIKSQNLSAAQIKALTKSQVQIPKNGYVLRSTLENHLCVIDYVFGKASYLYTAIADILTATNNYKRKFEAMTENNPDYIASFMQGIDIRTQLFFESCASATSPNNIHFDALDFSEEIGSFIIQKTLATRLPTLIQQMVTTMEQNPSTLVTQGNKKKGGNKNKVTDEELDAKKKRKKQDGKGSGKGGKPVVDDEVVNTSPVDPAWIKKKESLQIFHKNLESMPTLKGKQICLKYHVKGVCSFGESCRHKDTHTNDFDDDTKEKFGAWLKLCREKPNEA